MTRRPPTLDYSRPDPQSIIRWLWTRIEGPFKAAYLIVTVTAMMWVLMTIMLVVFVAVRSLIYP